MIFPQFLSASVEQGTKAGTRFFAAPFLTPAFLTWVRDTPLAMAIRQSAWMLPAIESAHLLAYASVIGTIVAIDFRVLGVGLRRESAAQIAVQLAPWTAAGMGLSAVTGALLFSYDPFKFAANRALPYKLALVAAAILFHFAALRVAVRREPPSPWAKVGALCSLALWLAVALAGLAISLELLGSVPS